MSKITAVYSKRRVQYPQAETKAPNLNEIAATVDAVRASLPKVKRQIGDPWIYGRASDPCKVARHREISRLRSRWLEPDGLPWGGDIDAFGLRNRTFWMVSISTMPRAQISPTGAKETCLSLSTIWLTIKNDASAKPGEKGSRT